MDIVVEGVDWKGDSIFAEGSIGRTVSFRGEAQALSS
jgi:hypothetical protein